MTSEDNVFRLTMRLRQYARYSLGRILGTVANSSGRYKWFIDNQERSLFMRAEINALTKLLVDKGAFTMAEWKQALETEFEAYGRDLASQWPEMTVAENGRSFVIEKDGFAKRCKDEEWPR